MSGEFARLFSGHGELEIAALLLGHFLADFVFQTRRMLERKKRLPGLLAHGVVVYVVHLGAFVFFLDGPALLVLLLVSVLHVATDAAKIAYESRRGASLGAFFLDQVVHVLIAVYAGMYLGYDGTPDRLPFGRPDHFIDLALIVAGAAFLWTGGSAVVRYALGRTRIVPDDDGTPAAGHAIGVLERLIVYVLVIAGQWAAAGLVIAAKSLARFESLKERRFAEYYLVGTLTSVFLAVLAGTAVRVLI